MSLATYVVIRTANVVYIFVCFSVSIVKTHYIVFFYIYVQGRYYRVCSHYEGYSFVALLAVKKGHSTSTLFIRCVL